MKKDPFFSDDFGGFGGMEKAFSKAHTMMSDMMSGHDEMMRGGSGGSGKFMKQTYVSSTKMGADGRPMKESYQTKAKGVYGRSAKPEIVERKQMYQNSHTGLEKAAHERMYHGKGRKVVMENDRSSGVQNSYNYYKNMREEEGQSFDQEWDSAAKRLGFYSDTKALPYGSGYPRPYKKSKTYKNYDDPPSYMDNRRRGHYIPNSIKDPNAPVRFNSKADTHVDRLMPTDPGGRFDSNTQDNNGGALALPPPPGNNAGPQRARARARPRINNRLPRRTRHIPAPTG
jgi:hypothetical protein